MMTGPVPSILEAQESDSLEPGVPAPTNFLKDNHEAIF
jgi:hypothetical protein